MEEKQYTFAVAFAATGTRTDAKDDEALEREGQVGLNVVAPTIRAALDKAEERVEGRTLTMYFRDAQTPVEVVVKMATIIESKRGPEVEV